MVRGVADRIYKELLSAFPPGEDRGEAEFGTEPMPGPVRTFLRKGVHAWAAAEIDAPSWEWINLADKEVREAWDSFRKTALSRAIIPADKWQSILEEAVHATVRYLVAPGPTLSEFVFRDEDASLPTTDILRRMAFFDGYPYLQDIIEGYFDRKEVDATSRLHFYELVQRVDRKMVEQYAADDWVKLLHPLFEMCRLVPDIDGRKAIPAEVLRAFFEEKHRGEVARKIAREQGRGLEIVDETNLRRILEEVTYSAAPPREERPVKHEAATHAHESVPQRPDTQPDSGQPVPLWKKFLDERSRGGDSEPAGPRVADTRRTGAPRFEASGDGDTAERAPMWAGVRPADVRGPERPVERAEDAHFRQDQSPGEPEDQNKQPLWMRFAKPSGGEKQQSGETPRPAADEIQALEEAVLGRISPGQRKSYVDDLFDGSRQDYEQVLRQLQGASSWAAASRIIGREVFQKYQVNIYSETAVSFTDAVESRF